MTDFRSLYRHGFARVAACTTPVALADPATNIARILEVARDCDREGVAVALFPELSVSGYAIDDLLLQDALLDAVEAAIAAAVAASAGLLPLIVVGAPLRHLGHASTIAAIAAASTAASSAWCRRCTCPTIGNSTSTGISHRATA